VATFNSNVRRLFRPATIPSALLASVMAKTPVAESSTLAVMNRDAIHAELLELEGVLQDDRLSDYDRIALHGAQQALRHVLEPDTWHPASQTFYRIDNRPSEAASLLVH
jgi:hypothetical protein